MTDKTEKTKLLYRVRCSCKAMKLYSEYGLDNLDGNEFIQNIKTLFVDTEKLDKLCKAMFTDKFDGIDFENDIDLEKVLEGIFFFGEHVLSIFRGSKRSEMISSVDH